MNFIKKNLAIIIFVGFCFIIMIIVFLMGRKSDVKLNGYLIFSNISSFYCNNDACEKTDNKSLSDKKLKYNMYMENELQKKAILEYGTVWNLFDSKYNYVSSPSDFFAYSEDLKLEYYEKETLEEELSNEDIEYIEDQKLDLNFKIDKKYSLNPDGEHKNNYVALATNFEEYAEEEADKYYWICFANINGKKQLIYKKEYKPEEITDLVDLDIYNIFTVGDNVYFTIIKKKYYNIDDNSIEIYKIDNKKLEKISK